MTTKETEAAKSFRALHCGGSGKSTKEASWAPPDPFPANGLFPFSTFRCKSALCLHFHPNPASHIKILPGSRIHPTPFCALPASRQSVLHDQLISFQAHSPSYPLALIAITPAVSCEFSLTFSFASCFLTLDSSFLAVSAAFAASEWKSHKRFTVSTTSVRSS